MKGSRCVRRVILLYAIVGLGLVLAGSVAGVGTYALLSDTEVVDAGTVTVVTNNAAAVNFKGCKQADITPADPNDFDMTVTLVDGRGQSYNETDFDPGADGTFTYETRNHWNGNPDMANVTLDGTTYTSPCG